MRGSVFRRHLGDGVISPSKLSNGLTGRLVRDNTTLRKLVGKRHLHVNFPGTQLHCTGSAVVSGLATSSGAATGAEEDINYIFFDGPLGGTCCYSILGTQTIILPSLRAGVTIANPGWLNFGLDADAGDGWCFTVGGPIASQWGNPYATRALDRTSAIHEFPGGGLGSLGTTDRGDKFIEVTATLDDASEADFGVGFIRTGGVPLGRSSFEDYYLISSEGDGGAPGDHGDVNTVSKYDDSGGETAADTGINIQDDEVFKMRVEIRGINQRAWINDIEVFRIPSQSWTVRSPIEFVPAMYFEQVAAGSGSKLYIQSIEAGDLETNAEDV
jgi:hypothetical protein